VSRRIRYADEFVRRFRELTPVQRGLVEGSIRLISSAEDPRPLAHHLERKAYFCNWSHRTRGNLLVVFGMTKRTLTFLSTGTHSQAYLPSR
jgi:mRNA-degrading endonuclease YafQ of YafQ-DinJ toxin-antitoxin module